MKDNLTDITMILDRSGSMEKLQKDVIGAFNTFIKEQKKVPGEAKFTLVQFDDRYEVNCEAISVTKVPKLTTKTYVPRGMTRLLDAIGQTFDRVGARLSALPEEERPSKVIVLIQTDGDENDSKEFSYARIKDMLTEQQEKYAWEIVFLGANINVGAEAGNLGVKASQAMKYADNSEGLACAFASVSKNMTSFRSGMKKDMSYEAEDFDAQRKAGV